MTGVSGTRWNLKAGTTDKLRRSHPTLAEIGLHDFENRNDCAKRQDRLCSALQTSEDGRSFTQALASCSPKGCSLPFCNDACYYASRRRRTRYILRAYRLLSSVAGPLYLVTVVHPNWEASLGGLRAERASQLAAQVEGCISVNYGVAFPPFITAVSEDRQTFIKRGKSLVEEFVEAVGAKGDTQKERLARKFGVAYAGGIIASELDILPSDSKHISKSISRLYKKAERVLGGPEGQSPSILKQIANGIRAGHFAILKKGESLETGDKPIWGVLRVIEGSAVVVIKLTELARLAGTLVAAQDLLVYWAKQGYILPSAEGKHTRQVEVRGWSDKRQRFVCLKRSALPTMGKAKGPVGK